MIHSASVLLGRKSAASAGSARYNRVTSSPSSMVGSASTARPAHSRAPAIDAAAGPPDAAWAGNAP